MGDQKKGLIGWHQLLKRWGIDSWHLQRLVAGEGEKLSSTFPDNDIFRTHPLYRGLPPVRLTNEDFAYVAGNPSDIFFDEQIIKKYEKKHLAQIKRVLPNWTEDDSGCDWSTYYTWEGLLKRWGFLDPFLLFQRFYFLKHKLSACWWNENGFLGRFDQRITEVSYALESLPEVSDLLFCGKHVEIYERACWKDFPASLHLASKYDPSYPVKPPKEALQPESLPPTGIEPEKWTHYVEAVKKRRKHYSDLQAHYWRSRAVSRYLEKKKSLSKAEAAVRTEITSLACEGVPYTSDRIETWLDKCEHPEDYNKTKIWGEQASQMQLTSRFREAFLALALVYLERNPKLTKNDIVTSYTQGEIGFFAAEKDLDGEGKNKNNKGATVKKKTIEKEWLKPLEPYFRPLGKT